MLNRYIDLHTHSTASDGADTPSQLIQKAVKMGLAAIALTDHDTVSGVPEFLECAKSYDSITAIPGVEISASYYSGEVHIVGLFVNHHCPSLNKLLKEIRHNRDQRNLIMIEKLQRRGYEISLNEILEVAGGESVGRPHFARILIEKGYFRETQEVFDECLKKGSSCYCSRRLPKPDKAIEEIHNAGGIAIWAHAVYRRFNEREYVKRTLNRLIRMGLDGMETFYTTFTETQEKMLGEIASRNLLLQSGGSDYHGQNQPTVSLGTGFGNLKVPEHLFHELQSYWQDRHDHKPAGELRYVNV